MEDDSNDDSGDSSILSQSSRRLASSLEAGHKTTATAEGSLWSSLHPECKISSLSKRRTSSSAIKNESRIVTLSVPSASKASRSSQHSDIGLENNSKNDSEPVLDPEDHIGEQNKRIAEIEYESDRAPEQEDDISESNQWTTDNYVRLIENVEDAEFERLSNSIQEILQDWNNSSSKPRIQVDRRRSVYQPSETTKTIFKRLSVGKMLSPSDSDGKASQEMQKPSGSPLTTPPSSPKDVVPMTPLPAAALDGLTLPSTVIKSLMMDPSAVSNAEVEQFEEESSKRRAESRIKDENSSDGSLKHKSPSTVISAPASEAANASVETQQATPEANHHGNLDSAHESHMAVTEEDINRETIDQHSAEPDNDEVEQHSGTYEVSTLMDDIVKAVTDSNRVSIVDASRVI